MKSIPRLTVGLPVYNGEKYLSESLNSLLAQTHRDFELIISDNASTDGTAEICQKYVRLDPRVTYIRQPRNCGGAANHNFLVARARGEFFKWAAHDDVYSPHLLERCIDALDRHPEAVLAHSSTAIIDNSGSVIKLAEYHLSTDSPYAPERFRSLLFDDGGDDDGAVHRLEVLRRSGLHGSHYRSDRTLVASLTLYGQFYHVPEWLYFRREHAERISRRLTVRSWCTGMDPARANKLRHPTARLLAEYISSYLAAIHQSPLAADEKRACYEQVGRWALSRCRLSRLRRGSVRPSCLDE